ncbi:MAG: hypothetical protein JHC40_16755 [Burkholderiales bacterium]|nr:hypothetical protein [Burkholderiales bacterium]
MLEHVGMVAGVEGVAVGQHEWGVRRLGSAQVASRKCSVRRGSGAAFVTLGEVERGDGAACPWAQGWFARMKAL